MSHSASAGEVTAGPWRKVTAYRRVYGFGQLRADCPGPGSDKLRTRKLGSSTGLSLPLLLTVTPDPWFLFESRATSLFGPYQQQQILTPWPSSKQFFDNVDLSQYLSF